MKLEERLVLNPRETLLLVVDIQRDFLESSPGFVFFDAGNDMLEMQAMVKQHLIPLIGRSIKNEAGIAYVKSHYEEGKFQPPYDKLCSWAPGTDFYLVDGVDGFEKVKIFPKSSHDTFSNPSLRQHIEEKKVKNLVVAGVTLTNCVFETVKSAVNIPNLKIVVPEDCVSYRKEREPEARAILAMYASEQQPRIIVVNSGNIHYRAF
ncbi:cysteine hydrolase [Candidatus Woesearchaeota archaeon]|nr:cysteine hydrolase [Candidatus Woesearchaeota archaeon]